MKKFKKIIVLSLSASLLVGCNSNVTNISISETGGGEGNASEDTVETVSTDKLVTLFTNVSKMTRYSYEITSNIVENAAHFIDYVTPNAFYELNDDDSASFGYGQEKDTYYMFKYYIKNETVTPSIYEYDESSTTSLTPITGMYSPLALTHINLLSYYLDAVTAEYAGNNRFAITNDDITSIFQYMSTYGSSISDYITTVYVEILDEEKNIFKTIIDCGSYGDIEGVFTPDDTKFIESAETKINNGEIKGVKYYDDVKTSLNEKFATTNYVLNGPYQITGTETITTNYQVNVTDKYFFIHYIYRPDPKYVDYGFAFVPKNTEVTYYDRNNDYKAVTQTIAYDCFYGFEYTEAKGYRYVEFYGPNETETVKYKQVDALPVTGDTAYLYIVFDAKENKTLVYEWKEVTSGTYGWSVYSEWFKDPSTVVLNGASASFYMASSLTEEGFRFFEKDLTKTNTYYTTNSTVMSLTANTIFGWGFQGTTTWMSYIEKTYLEINKNSSGEITDVNLGQKIANPANPTTQRLAYYNIHDFGNANIAGIDSFYNTSIGA
jgi:hypothetical protein